MFKLNPKQIEKAMKRMGVKQEQIDAKEVIIKCNDKNLIIKNPQVSKVNMMGQESLQILGDIEEQKEEFSEDDIKMIMEKTGCSKAKVKEALEKTHDIAEAILSLTKE